jgi:hypothetical protein
MREISFSGSAFSLHRKNTLIFSGEWLFRNLNESLISKLIHIGFDLTTAKRAELLDFNELILWSSFGRRG